MKFDVAALRAAAEQALVADRAQWDQARAKEAEERAQERAEWVQRWGQEWLDATKVIARRCRKGEPIARGDIPGDRYHSVPTFEDRPERPRREYLPPVELTVLARVLELVADEHVTTAGLRDLGVTPSALRACVVHMATATVRG